LLLRALTVHQFRNLVPTGLTFASARTPGPQFHVISGDNGQGKTNLLEAIYLVGTLRSFRTQHGQEMVRWGDGEARVGARVERRGLERVYEVTLGPRRVVKLDGKSPRSLGEYFGDFNVVLFAPEDLRVPRGSPAGRRRFLDRSVFNRDASFLQVAQDYARVLKSRNVLLKNGTVDLLDVYDEQLATLGAQVVRARRAYLAELGPLLAEAYESITQSGLAATAGYETSAGEGGELDAAALLKALRGSRRRDLARKQTSVGPHVDDVDFRLGDHGAKAFASQGQLRALVLAWKTAEMRYLREVHGDSPVLLLDDVSSELDPDRNRFLFDFLTRLGCQCFVTTTHPAHVLVSENREDYRVVAGVVTPSN
jgi:DNA replication and repair protein RecF